MSRYTLASLTALNTFLYRMTDGTVGGQVPNGGNLLLLTTTGRRSGRKLTVPLLFIAVDAAAGEATADRVVVVASKGGEPSHPAWFHNVQAEPRVEVQLRGWHGPATARVAADGERQVLWPRLVARYRYFADYQHRTGGRRIPLVVLDLDRAKGGPAADRFRPR